MVEFSIVSVVPQFHLLNLENLVGFSLSIVERMVVLTILIDLPLQLESCIAETASVVKIYKERWIICLMKQT